METTIPVHRIVQNGYVVRDLDSAIFRWNRIVGIGPFFVNNKADHPAFECRGAKSSASLRSALSQAGDVQIELIQPMDSAPSIFRETLDSVGEGLHHVKIETGGYDAQYARFIRNGFSPAMQGEITGLVRFSFFDTCAELGHFTEISETFGSASERDVLITEICRKWDGVGLVRDVAKLTDV